MKTEAQWVVIYKDTPKARNLYFGPFVSDTMADQFMSNLPEPLPGGMKTYKLLSPFTFDEVRMASSYIVNSRCGREAKEYLIHNHHR